MVLFYVSTFQAKQEGTAMKTFVETSSILLEGIDEMIREGYFHDRAEAVNEALKEMLDRYKLSKLRAKEQRLTPRRKESRKG
jgi:Arc/MetJ-type ribon-helix-helix transcriptional regulator